MLFDKLKALQITIDDLNVENFPGPWFTKMFDISAIFMLFDFKNSNIIMEILSKFSLLFEYSLV